MHIQSNWKKERLNGSSGNVDWSQVLKINVGHCPKWTDLAQNFVQRRACKDVDQLSTVLPLQRNDTIYGKYEMERRDRSQVDTQNRRETQGGSGVRQGGDKTFGQMPTRSLEGKQHTFNVLSSDHQQGPQSHNTN